MLKLQGAQLVLLVGCWCAVLPGRLAAENPVPTLPSVQQPAGPTVYDRRLTALQRDFEQQSSEPAMVLLLAEISDLRDYTSDPTAVDLFLEGVANDPNRPPLVRDEARFRRAFSDLHTGRVAAADAAFTSMGFVRSWAIVGPLTTVDTVDGDTVDDDQRRPEAGFQPGAEFVDATGKTQTWHVLPPSGAQPWVDPYLMLPTGDGEVFAATALYADGPATVALRFSALAAATLFVNGRQLADTAEHAGLGLDQQAVAVALAPGWNSVVLKLRRSGQGDLRFGLRVTALEGGGIARRAAAEQVATVAATPTANGTPADLLQMAKAAFEREPSSSSSPFSATASETVGRLLCLRGDRAADGMDYLEAAARRAPTPQRWLTIAAYCPDSACAFAALNNALEADPENEPARVGLARYYLARRQLEKARDLSLEAIAREPSDFEARSLLADACLTVGLRAAALRQYERMEGEFAGTPWLLRRLAADYLGLGLLNRAAPVLTRAALQGFDDRETQSLRLELYRRRHDEAGLRSVYQDRLQVNPYDTASLGELAALDSGAGDYLSAERRLRQALALTPRDGGLHQRLADLFTRLGKTAEARHEFARALQADPNLERARLQLGDPAAGESEDRESPYLANPAALAATARQSPPPTTGNAVRLAEIRIERVYQNGLSDLRQQQIVYLASEQGARDFSTRKLQFAPGAQQLRLLHARVYKPDGRVLEGEEGGDSAVADTAVAMYYDVRARLVHFPALQQGDVIELDYRITPTINSNPYGSYFGSLIAFRGGLARQLQRYVLITPAHRHFNLLEERMPPAVVTVAGDERVYCWEARDTQPLPSEPKGPALTDLAPYVHVSTFQSWDELGRWYARMIQPQFALDAGLREQLARLLQDARTDTERIRAIHQFVLRNTHYVAMEFGIYSYQPYPVSQVYARRFGDCKDKAALMIALLRQAGIAADMALVRTRRLGRIAPRATSVALFNHAVVYVPKFDLWLDGTAEYAGLSELPLDDQGAMALTVGADGRATLRQIPVTQPGDNYSRRTVRARVMTDGRIRFAGVAFTRGEDAPGLRREYESPERQRDAVRNSFAEIFPSVRLEDVRVRGANDLERPVTVEFRGTVDSFAGHQTVPLAASWIRRSYVQQLAPLTSRSADLLLPAPWTTDEDLHFELPAGAAVAALPADFALQTSFGKASVHYQRNEHELVINTSVEFRQLRITPAEYTDFREFCQQVERALRCEIKIRLTGSEQ